MTQTVGHLLPRFWSVGAATADLGPARLTRRPGLEAEPTALFLHDVRPGGPDDLDGALDRARRLAGAPCRRVFLDAATPPWTEATLLARDWHVEATLQLVLPADVAVPPPGDVAVRPARSDDWDALAALFRADHEEEDRRAARPARPAVVTERVVAARRALPEPVRYLVAVDGDDTVEGFVAAWPGDDATGLVEDLFVRPDRRGRRLATALVAHAVDHARYGGAGAVVIGADPGDTPKHLYRRLGFVPAEVLRTATRPDDAGAR